MFLKNLSRNAKVLTGFTVVSIALLSGVNYLLKDTIAQTTRDFFYQQIKVFDTVVSKDQYDNDLIKSCLVPKIQSPKAEPKIEQLYQATKNSNPVAFIFVYSTNQGYNGYIKNLLVTDAQGKILTLKILEQQETPGLGTKVVTEPWAESFREKTLADAQAKHLKVQKDGGQIPYFTGATITPRAIANATEALMLETVYKVVKDPKYLAGSFLSCLGG